MRLYQYYCCCCCAIRKTWTWNFSQYTLTWSVIYSQEFVRYHTHTFTIERGFEQLSRECLRARSKMADSEKWMNAYAIGGTDLQTWATQYTSNNLLEAPWETLKNVTEANGNTHCNRLHSNPAMPKGSLIIFNIEENGKIWQLRE